MQFNSISFMVFFPVVITTYFIVPRKLRMPWLLVASYYFYMSWNPKYVVLIGFSTAATWLCGVLLEQADRGRFRLPKKALVALCLIANLAILGFFKYGNFALETLDALFVSFFPQLVAGPIERSRNLLEQMRDMERTRLWDGHRVASGAVLMVWGFFMKMVVADRAAIVVDNVFADYQMCGSTELIFAAVLFAVQIYCDFGSYSMIAVGAAKIMGFSLMENFNAPYLARSIRDFWSRWYISLSGWFRDYLYIPLGGNRKGPGRKALNKLTVFLASGLCTGLTGPSWPGAAFMGCSK